MEIDDLIFINEQLAALVKTGIPLEGALKQTSKDLKKGKYKLELYYLSDDLASGTPFSEAIQNCNFPEFYKKMLIIGAETNKLSEIFTNVANYYRKKQELKIKLSKLMFYPIMVFVLFCAFFLLFNTYIGAKFWQCATELLEGERLPFMAYAASNLNISIVVICFVIIAILILLQSNRIQWIISPYKEANLANLCSMISLCLKNGLQLPYTLELLADVDDNPMLSSKLKEIHKRISEGDTVSDAFSSCSLFPDILSWILNSFEDNLEIGFNSAKEIFYSRSSLKTEVFLNLFIPSSIIVLGCMVLLAFLGYFGPLISILEKLGG